MRYYLEISSFDCCFYLLINDIPFLDQRGGGNITTAKLANQYLFNQRNTVRCLITPSFSSDTILPTSALKLTVFTANSPAEPRTEIKQISTPVFEESEEIPLPSDYVLTDFFMVDNIRDMTLSSGQELSDTPQLRQELMSKYEEIWDYLHAKKFPEIKSFFSLRDRELDLLLDNPPGHAEAETMEEYTDFMANPELELWVMNKEKMDFKVYAGGKLVCYELKNGNSPLCYVNRQEGYAVYFSMYFQRDPQTRNLVVVR